MTAIVVVVLAACVTLVQPLAVTSVLAAEFGANKFDLLLQYTGRASGGDGSPEYRRVTRAMGRKAILDARDVGFAFFRISASGFSPSAPGMRRHDLELWQANPEAYWRLVDGMFDDLDHADVKVVATLMWNQMQFSALAGEPTYAIIHDPQSRSRHLLKEYISEFINRYKARKTILFYELTNELNLFVDLGGNCARDQSATALQGCNADAHFTTTEMISFGRDMVFFIKRLDSGRSVSSGFGIPRPAAYHLEKQPAFSPRGADWTNDTLKEFEDNLVRTQAPFDMVSVHLYSVTQNNRFGRDVGSELDLIDDVARVGDLVHKPVFVGEFGGVAGSPFLKGVMQRLSLEKQVEYAAVWVWEYYPDTTYRSFDTLASEGSLEPGLTDDIIAFVRSYNSAPAAHRAGTEGGTTAPLVVLTWPLPCAQVDHTLDLWAVASSAAGGIDHVDFLVDGALAGSASSPPFRVRFDPNPLGTKIADVEARATDRKGNTAAFKSPVRLNSNQQACAAAETTR